MTQTYTTEDGVKHPISDGFLLYPAAYDEARERDILTRWRASEELAPDEREYLAAWTNRANLETAWKWLAAEQGHPHYTDHFGDEGTLDQVHGQAWSPDVCGCTHHQVFDHNRRDEPGGQNPILSHRIHKLCDRHASVAHPDRHDEHHERLLKECQHKEAVLQAITDGLGLPVHQRPAWHYNKNHELVLDTSGHPTLTPANINPILREQFGHHVVHVR